MAIWQFRIYFIPRLSLFDKYGQVPTQLEMNKEGWKDYIESGDLDKEPEFEDALSISWWSTLNLDIKELLPTLQQFGELQEWTARTEGLRSFGDTETNDISVSFDHQTHKVQELSCRLDLRQIDKGFINRFLSLATRHDCLLMDSQGRLYEPTVEKLFDTIQLSNANRFVEDPRQFFDDLSKGIITPE
ncbi:MAG: hypothetical protein ACJ75B_09415 [Flavisolibacter sp.]